MINYNPSDPTTEIIFNLQAVTYEARKLASPTASFVLGEWVGLGANETAVKIASSSFVLPGMVYTPTDRHDVTESEKVTVVRGYCHLSTMNYKVGESFAIGSRVIVVSDGGIGKIGILPAGADTYEIIGKVRIPPAVDGTSRLVVEIYPLPVTIVVP